ncbi:class III lanthipeptide [Frateuria aurantia]
MERILDLQKIVSENNDANQPAGNSSSSDHNCACSTNSAAACFIGSEIIAI